MFNLFHVIKLFVSTKHSILPLFSGILTLIKNQSPKKRVHNKLKTRENIERITLT